MLSKLNVLEEQSTSGDEFLRLFDCHLLRDAVEQAVCLHSVARKRPAQSGACPGAGRIKSGEGYSKTDYLIWPVPSIFCYVRIPGCKSLFGSRALCALSF